MRYILISLSVFFSSWAFSTPVFSPWLGEEKLFKAIPSYEYQSFRTISEGDQIVKLHSSLHLFNFQMQVALTSNCELLAKGQMAQSSDWGLKVSEGVLATRYQMTSDIQGDLLSSALNLSVTVPNGGLVKDPQLLYHGDADGELSISLGKEVTKGKYWLLRYWSFIGIGAANDSKPWGHLALGATYNFNSYIHLYVLLNAYRSFSKESLNLDNFKGYGRIGQKSCDLHVGCRWYQNYYGYLTASLGKRLTARNGPKDNVFARVSYTIPFSL